MYQLGSGSTETWNDGVVKTYPTGSLYSTRRTLTAGVTYTATIDGTYNRMNASADLSKCLRSVDHWGSNTGVVSAKDAFTGAINLTSVPAHIPSTITDMQSMFSGATSFNDPNIGQWNVSKVTQMTSMFEGATSFNQSLNNWNVSSLNNAFSMFKNAVNFNQPLNNWNVGSITNMGMMFSGATAFNQDLASWNTEKVQTMAYMFDAPHTMKNNVKHNTSSTTTTLTYKCDVNTVDYLPMYQLGSGGTETWNDGQVRSNPTGTLYSMKRLFTAGVTYTVAVEGTYQSMGSSTDLSKCLRSVDHWGSATGVVSTENAFKNAINLTQVTSQIPPTVTNMQSMFSGATRFNDSNISQWSVSSVTNMTSMFEGATSFNQSLNSWNVSKATNLFSMFKNASSFNQSLSNWDTGAATNMSFMFSGANTFNQDLASWNTGKVKTMAYMFDLPNTMKNNVKNNTINETTTLTYKCDVNTTDRLPMYQLGSDSTETWNDGVLRSNPTGSLYALKRTLIAGVTYTAVVEGTYRSMGGSTTFSNCLRSVDHWGQNTGVVSSQNAFKNAINLTKVTDSVPNTITNMNSMFYGASNFNQNLSGWNVGNVTTRTDFSTGSGLTSSNLPLFK
jgi:surface protein